MTPILKHDRLVRISQVNMGEEESVVRRIEIMYGPGKLARC